MCLDRTNTTEGKYIRHWAQAHHEIERCGAETIPANFLTQLICDWISKQEKPEGRKCDACYITKFLFKFKPKRGQ